MIEDNKRNRVCHISTVHDLMDDRIFFKECCTLSKNGYEVCFIVKNDTNEKVKDIQIVPISESSGRFSRVFIKGWDAFNKALKVDADIYHFHDPELIFFGLLLKIFGKKVIYDIHEDVPQQILSKSWLGPTFIRKIVSNIFNFFEKGISSKFDAVINVTSTIQLKFKNKRNILLRNFPIKEMIDLSQESNVEKNKPVIIYVGGLTEIRGIRELVKVTGMLGGKVELWLVGSFDDDDYKLKCEEEKGWTYTRCFGYRPMNEVYSIMKRADIGMCTLYSTGNHRNSLPVKAFEYMSCSLPMIMSNFDYWKEYYAECSLFTDPYDCESIKECVDKIINDESLKQSLGNNGRKLIDTKYSWEVESLKLLELYKDILQN